MLHGDHVGFLGVVYPLLLSPFYGAFDAAGAFDATHIVNAVLFASAAIPVYLLTRRLAGTPCALVVSLLSVAVPWCVNAAFVMSEAAAYPVFLWAVLACHAAVSEPSPRRDALAVGALALAFFTRPQFLFLAAVLPIAALIADGPRGAWRRHRPLAVAYAVAILVVVPLAALGESHRLLGDYGVTATKGSLLPLIALKSAAIHLDVLAVGLGVVPFLLGAGWAYSRLRDADRRRRAFAALAGAVTAAARARDGVVRRALRGTDVVRDRYLFYLAPLLLLASALCLMDDRLPLPGIAGATAFFSVTVCFADFGPVAGLWVDSPESVLNGALHDASGPLPTGVFVALCGLVLGVACIGLALWSRPAAPRRDDRGLRLRRERRRLRIRAPADEQHAAGDSGNRPAASAGLGRPLGRRTVALLAYPVSRVWGQSAILWWDVELWNNRVQQAFVDPDGTWTYTPFPAESLRLDFERGVFDGTERLAAVRARGRKRLSLRAEGEAKTSNLGLVLLKTERPYRVSWASRGLDAGRLDPAWPTRHGANLRGSPVRRPSTALLDAPPEATAPPTYRLGDATGAVDPGTRATVRTTVCISPQGHADLTLETGRSATVDGRRSGPSPEPSRAIGLALSGVNPEPPARPAHRRITACPTTTKAAAAFRTASTRAASPTASTSGSSTTTIDEDDRAFIEARDMFFIATADAEGRPQCSYKGGEPGFVRVLDERTIAFPVYDGNGMYLTAGTPSSTRRSGSCSSTSRDGSGSG